MLGTERKRRGLCCLWPSSSSASARGAYGVPLKAWQGREVVEAEAVDLRHLVQVPRHLLHVVVHTGTS